MWPLILPPPHQEKRAIWSSGLTRDYFRDYLRHVVFTCFRSPLRTEIFDPRSRVFLVILAWDVQSHYGRSEGWSPESCGSSTGTVSLLFWRILLWRPVRWAFSCVRAFAVCRLCSVFGILYPGKLFWDSSASPIHGKPLGEWLQSSKVVNMSDLSSEFFFSFGGKGGEWVG